MWSKFLHVVARSNAHTYKTEKGTKTNTTQINVIQSKSNQPVTNPAGAAPCSLLQLLLGPSVPPPHPTNDETTPKSFQKYHQETCLFCFLCLLGALVDLLEEDLEDGAGQVLGEIVQLLRRSFSFIRWCGVVYTVVCESGGKTSFIGVVGVVCCVVYTVVCVSRAGKTDSNASTTPMAPLFPCSLPPSQQREQQQHPNPGPTHAPCTSPRTSPPRICGRPPPGPSPCTAPSRPPPDLLLMVVLGEGVVWCDYTTLLVCLSPGTPAPDTRRTPPPHNHHQHTQGHTTTGHEKTHARTHAPSSPRASRSASRGACAAAAWPAPAPAPPATSTCCPGCPSPPYVGFGRGSFVLVCGF